MKKYNLQRTNIVDWDTLFMAMAYIVEERSKDPSTQVGAVIVSQDNRVLSLGYNGAPNGFNDDVFPWARDGSDLETKYLFVVHAERNAILNYRGSKKDLENSKVYVSLFPCNECAKEIVQSGIKEVIYVSDKYHDSDSTKASKIILEQSGVTYRQLEETKLEKITDLFEEKAKVLKKIK